MTSLLLAFWILIGSIHIGVPFAYFGAMRRIGSTRDYHLSSESPQEPTVSVLIPTYNEASVINEKLSNVMRSKYPANKIELIVIDSASTDRTAEIARSLMAEKHFNGIVVEEPKRSGKSGALNIGLTHATGQLICISDAECRWQDDALPNAVKYFSDPSIGAVSGVHGVPSSTGSMAGNVEGSYRSVYRMLRIAESKLFSTPVGEGEIQLFRNGQLSSFDPTVGGDDTCAALCIVDKGLRAISAEDVVFFDPAPPAWRVRFRQKIRRGQHVLQAFLKHKRLLRGRGAFSRLVFPMEFFLYAINPLLFPLFLVSTALVMITMPLIGYLIAAALVLVLAVPGLRTAFSTYLSNNMTMLAAIVQEARGNKQLVWTKIDENRPGIQKPTQPMIAQ